MRGKWLAWVWVLIAVPLWACAAAPASASSDCQINRQAMYQAWQAGAYDTSSAVADIMVAAMDGRTAKVRKSLDVLPGTQAKRWRQLALSLAALAGRSTTVAALLDDGATLHSQARTPPFKSGFRKQLINQARRDPRFGGSGGTAALKNAGTLGDDSGRMPAAIFGAVMCNDLATVKVLLAHDADPTYQPFPHGDDAFMDAVLEGDAEITRLFLDHGADPCVEDRRIAANARNARRATSAHTIADLGRKSGFPAALVEQLTCHTPTVTKR